MPFDKLDGLSHPISLLPDRMENEAAYLKYYFDGSPKQLLAAHNALVNDLENAEAGSSGAESIGSAPIDGLAGTTVHAQMSALAARAGVGGAAPGSITPDMLGPDLAAWLANPLISAGVSYPFSGRYNLYPACALDFSAELPRRLIFIAPTAASAGHTLTIEGCPYSSVPVVDGAGKAVAAGAWGLATPVEVCYFAGRAYLR